LPFRRAATLFVLTWTRDAEGGSRTRVFRFTLALKEFVARAANRRKYRVGAGHRSNGCDSAFQDCGTFVDWNPKVSCDGFVAK
jgi:hypothetical protein